MENNNPSVGDVINVKITSINEEIGAFVEMPNGITGLIRLHDFAWFNQANIMRSYNVGDELSVKVIKQLPDGKLNLSRRELLPNPRTIEKGRILYGTVQKVIESGLIIRLGDFNAYANNRDIPKFPFFEGEKIMCCVIDNTYDEVKHRNKILVRILDLIKTFAQNLSSSKLIECTYTGNVVFNDEVYAIVELVEGLNLKVPSGHFIEPFKTRLLNNEIQEGEVLRFILNSRGKLDMRPIEKEEEKRKKREDIENFTSQVERGSVLESQVVRITKAGAVVNILGTNINSFIPRDELSPNKVIKASDEVFVGEHVNVVYLGQDNGKLQFSRRFLVEDKYDQELYGLSLDDLLLTMGLHTSRFIGKAILIKDSYFFSDLISVSSDDNDTGGKLLIDPINGKSIIVLLDNRLRNFVMENEWYSITIDTVNERNRRKQGTPYVFRVVSNDIKPVANPYEEAVKLSFKKQMSPSSNTSLANLLEEVGQNLYIFKDRMFFELLQNADDEAAENGVQVKVQIGEKYFVLTHNGYPFNKHDFDSIISAAKSTKSANKKKTGYKGIGFKSVFTNSSSVFIKSGGFTFSFDKNNPIFNNFKSFYFLVNDIENDEIKQSEFLVRFEKEFKEFRDVRDIPWQLLPIWSYGSRLDEENTIFGKGENVSIALRMDRNALLGYSNALKAVFDEPRFMLFLRNTKRVQLIEDESIFTIQKNIDTKNNIVSLVSSFNESSDDYRIYSVDGIEVSDESFELAGIPIKRAERKTSKEEKENYFVRIDEEGNAIGEVSGVPDRIASTTETSISFALKLNEQRRIEPMELKGHSLYAYLPMNDHRFQFPFFINADFIPKSDREVISDNPWNTFLFYIIGRSIVSMVASCASVDEPDYLKLLPDKDLIASGQDGSSSHVLSFNKGYHSALEEIEFVLNDENNLSKASDIIFDESGLSECIGFNGFYSVIGSEKRLPNPSIDSSILSKSIFGVKKLTTKSILSILYKNIDILNDWIKTTNDDIRYKFYEWISDKETQLYEDVISLRFEGEWFSYKQALELSKIITTEKISTIKNILEKIGFSCSYEILESHPLATHFRPQDERQLFTTIKNSSLDCLSFEEKVKLFNCIATFENIGPETMKQWPVFHNQRGELKPLNTLFSYNDSLPTWLEPYMLSSEESHKDIRKYLLESKKDVYGCIIEEFIGDILQEADVLEVYSVFQETWNPGFTTKLIDNKTRNILSIVEQSDDKVKTHYIKSLSELDLKSNDVYGELSDQYRIIKIAASVKESISYIRRIITVDGVKLDDITLKDDFHVLAKNVSYRFFLSKLLPTFSTTSNLNKVVSNFDSIPGYENIFAQIEAKPEDVKDQLFNYLQTNTMLLTVDQFYFLMMYMSSKGNTAFGNVLRPVIRINSQELFTKILDRCLSDNTAEILGDFLKDRFMSYPCGVLQGKYIGCEVYTLESERVPEFISSWASTNEKKQFLLKLGVLSEDSREIKRRKSFKDNELDDIWNVVDTNIIKKFLEWVRSAFMLPISAENQVSILQSLFSKLRLSTVFYEEDLIAASHEWTNALYHQWKTEHQTSIFIVDGLLPYRGVYSNSYLFKGKQGEFTYFDASKRIYITSENDPASTLRDLYSKNPRVFSKDDWNKIFLVSADLVQEKDKRIAELEKLLEDAYKRPNDEVEVREHGNYVESDNIDPEVRKELNRDARFAAKDYLDSKEEIDCSAWDPEESSHIIRDKILFNGKKIVVVVTSSRGRKLYLHPYVFAEIMEDPHNLLLNYGYDNRIHPLRFKDIFEDNPNVNLIFDTDVVSPKSIAELANRYRWSKKTCFVIENPKYSQSDVIQSFGLQEKKEDGNVNLDFSEDDIFGTF